MNIGAVVLDSGNSEQLSDFYAAFLGWKKIRYDEEWIIVGHESKQGTPLVFQEIEGYQRPVWPEKPGQQQQQMHLDFYVEYVQQSVKHALDCGASVSEVQASEDYRIMLDPAGHPFCILPKGEMEGVE